MSRTVLHSTFLHDLGIGAEWPENEVYTSPCRDEHLIQVIAPTRFDRCTDNLCDNYISIRKTYKTNLDTATCRSWSYYHKFGTDGKVLVEQFFYV